MPQAAAFVVYKVGAVIGTKLAIAIADAAIKIAFLAAVDAMLRPDQRIKQNPRYDVTTRSGTEPVRIVYGEDLVSGPVGFNNVTGNENQFLHFTIPLAGHEVHEMSDIWLDDRVITTSQWPWAGDGSNGEVNNTSLLYGKNTPGAAFGLKYGTVNQTANGSLVADFSEWTNNHRGREIAWVWCKFILGDKTTKIWEGGPPQNIRVKIKGKKVYDPRKDSINGGSGTHRLADSTTWEWSDNPILCTVDYIRDADLGMGLSDDLFDWAEVIAEANYCDALVNVPDGTEKRYTCNGTLLTTVEHRDNIRSLLSSFNGRFTFMQGKLHITAARYILPTKTIDETWLAGDVAAQSGPAKSDRFNTIKAIYTDAANFYKRTETAELSGTTYINRDGGEILNRELLLEFTKSNTMAQRITLYQLQQTDDQLTVTLKCNYKALQLGMHEFVNLNISQWGWTNKLFRVVGWKFADLGTENQGIELALKEETATNYNDPDAGDYVTYTPSGVIVFPGKDIPAPSNPSATGVIGGNIIRWTKPAQDDGWTGIRVYGSTANDFGTATEIAEVGKSSYVYHEFSDEATWYYWIVAYRGGYESTRVPNTTTTSTTATGLKGTAGASAGTDLYNEAQVLLFNKDIANDRFLASHVGSLNFNAYMGIQLGNLERPAGWYRSGGAGAISYVNPEIRDRAIFPAGQSVSSVAIPYNGFDHFNIILLAQSSSGTASVTIRVFEYDTELLPSGKSVIGEATNAEPEVQAATRTITRNTWNVSDANMQLAHGNNYRPTSTCKWFSIAIESNVDLWVDWYVCYSKADFTSDNNNWSDVFDDDGFRPDDNATFNNGNLADLDTVGPDEVDSDALDQEIILATLFEMHTVGKDSFTDTTAGIWLGYHAGAYKINIGDANHFFKWDGVDLDISGINISNGGGGYQESIGIGSGALAVEGNTGQNVAIGTNTLNDLTTGVNNVAIGYVALDQITTGQGNVAIGTGAGGSITGAAGTNTFIGVFAGLNLGTSSSGNVCIGYNTGPTISSTQSNKLYIHNNLTSLPLILGDFSSRDLDFHGDVHIDDVASGSSGTLTVDGTAFIAERLEHIGDSNTYLRFTADTVDLYAGGIQVFQGTVLGAGTNRTWLPITDNTYDLGTSSFRWDDIYATNNVIQTSDKRRKTNITNIDPKIAVKIVKLLRFVNYMWKSYKQKSSDKDLDGKLRTFSRTHWGIIAQEFEDVLEEVGLTPANVAAFIYDAEADVYGMRYGELIPLLGSALQDVLDRLERIEEHLGLGTKVD